MIDLAAGSVSEGNESSR